MLIRSIYTAPIYLCEKKLYLSLVRSQFCYCSQLWRPHLIKDIQEGSERRSSNLQDYSSDYKSRLLALGLLQLMYYLDLLDIIFWVMCSKFPPDNLDFVSFVSSTTRSTSSRKLRYVYHRCSVTRRNYVFQPYCSVMELSLWPSHCLSPCN